MRARRLLVAVAVAVGFGLAIVPPAAALDVDACGSRSAPEPRSPRSSISALVASAPREVPDSDGLGPDAPPADLYATYGTAGLWWPTYDPGCNPASAWAMEMPTAVANLGNAVQNFLLDATAATRSWAWRTDWLEPVDDAMEVFTRSIGPSASPMVGVGLVVAGAWIAFRARRADLAETAKLAGWAVGMMVLGVFALSAPTVAAGLVDEYGGGAVALVEGVLAGEDVTGDEGPVDGVRGADPLVGLTARQVSYRAWLTGMFGDPDSDTAAEYGPRFYRAMSLSWADLELPEAELEALETRKQEAFRAAAEDLRAEDPSAFAVLQGRTAWSDRVPAGWLSGMFLTAAMTLFAFVAGVCVLLARLVTRFGVMALPVVIPFSMVMPYRQLVSSVLKAVGGAVVTALVYTVAAGVLTRVVAAVLRSSMEPFMVALVVGALSLLLLWKLRAWRVVATVVGLRAVGRIAAGGASAAGRAVPDPAPPARAAEVRPAPVLPSLWGRRAETASTAAAGPSTSGPGSGPLDDTAPGRDGRADDERGSLYLPPRRRQPPPVAPAFELPPHPTEPTAPGEAVVHLPEPERAVPRGASHDEAGRFLGRREGIA